MPHANVLIVFIRQPVAGRVKTRLAATVGGHAACTMYAAMAEHVVRNVQSDAWTTVLYVDESDGLLPVQQWLGMAPREQRGNNLGERLANAVADYPRARVVVIGTDAPDVDAAVITTAFASLADYHVVLGPAYDGGYYLIGLQSPLPAIFEGIDWSTDRVMLQTVQAAVTAGATVKILDPLRDIDVEEDVRSYIAERHNTTLGRQLEVLIEGHSN